MTERIAGLLAGMVGLFMAIDFCKGEAMAAERELQWSGYTWGVKDSGKVQFGPGPNYWSSDYRNVWVDAAGSLHLKITYRDGTWYSSEIFNMETLGFGTYRFYLESRIDTLDPNVVLGLYTYDTESIDAADKHYREIDIEFSRWGNPEESNSWYTVQPHTEIGNVQPFKSEFSGEYSTHSFSWAPEYIRFQSLHGHYAHPPHNDYVSHDWLYEGMYVPDSSQEKVDLNLWLFEGKPPQDGKEVEIVIRKFEFEPFDWAMGLGGKRSLEKGAMLNRNANMLGRVRW
ncbi:glycoside hydrolase family 16 protein [Peribacillus sp. SCS-155]|uniref:glycoside hydrolase family 16 protein n=1 Tax=Peribacillus sedimenti TaxID=3115297 RepID=UPI003906D03D